MTKKMTVRAHKIAALKYALNKLENNKESEYICWVLSEYKYMVYANCPDSQNKAGKAVSYLKQYIAQSIGSPYDNWHKEYCEGKGLDDWLREKGYNCGYSRSFNKKLQQTRINYVKWMIACYEGKA